MNRSAIKLLQAIARGHLKKSDRTLPVTGGFTLIELLAVVVIIGILAAIAAPGWLGFTNNRRASSVNDAVLQALNEARNKARTEKLAYSVSFRTVNSMPQIAVHPASIDASSLDAAQINSMANYWNFGTLSRDVDVRANQILVQTNIESRNKRFDPANFVVLPDSPSTQVSSQTITFDHTGELIVQENGDEPDLPLVVRVAVPNPSNSTQPLTNTIRCIRVQTLLGSLVIGRSDSECQPSGT